MLKKKKQNVCFRFGLKPQQGKLFATYIVPREIYGNLSIENAFIQSDGYTGEGRYDLIVSSTAFPFHLLLNDTIAHHPKEINAREDGIVAPTVIDFLHSRIGGLCFIVSVNEKKEIVYRYISHSRNTVVFPDTYYSEVTQSNGVLQVKEKKYNNTASEIGDETNITDTFFYQVITRKLAPGVDIGSFVPGTPEYQDAVSLFISGGETVSSSYKEFSLSPMGSIIIAALSSSDENLLPPYYQPTVIDRFGSSTEIAQYFYDQALNPDGTPQVDGSGNPIPPEPYTYPAKIITNYSNAEATKYYYDNWTSDFVTPTILKANDKDNYLITDASGFSFFLIDGEEIPLVEEDYIINNQTVHVTDYVKFFSIAEMMQRVLFKNNSLEEIEYRMDGLYFSGNPADRDKGYMVFSWFGDYIYKVRIDELVNEPQFSESALYNYNIFGNPPNISIPQLKIEAENVGLTPGCFFLDVLERNKLSQENIEKLSKFLEWSGINSLLKIYHPETSQLWVDKFKIERKESGTRILFQDRFLTPFTTPLRQSLKITGDWDIDTMNDILPRLKSICYVPFD